MLSKCKAIYYTLSLDLYQNDEYRSFGSALPLFTPLFACMPIGRKYVCFGIWLVRGILAAEREQ